MNETLNYIEQLVKRIRNDECIRDNLADMREEENFPCVVGNKSFSVSLWKDDAAAVCTLLEQRYTERIKDMKEELMHMMDKAITEEPDID